MAVKAILVLVVDHNSSLVVNWIRWNVLGYLYRSYIKDRLSEITLPHKSILQYTGPVEEQEVRLRRCTTCPADSTKHPVLNVIQCKGNAKDFDI